MQPDLALSLLHGSSCKIPSSSVLELQAATTNSVQSTSVQLAINLQLLIHVTSHFTRGVKIIAMTSLYLETNRNHRHRFV